MKPAMTEPRRKRALITRPREDSADAAIALARRGITPVLAPMMRIEYAAANIENEVSLAQAILFTSRNGVRAFSRLSARRDIAVLAVGDSTAALARDNGFVNVESARGDSADLARLTIERLDPADGLLFHAAGATVAGDLADALNKAGFKSVRRALYEAKAEEALDDETATALRDRTLDYVLFFSPRTGRIFAELVEKAGLAHTCDSLTAICLSEAVASEISGLSWRETVTAKLPTTAALLSVITEIEGSGAPPVSADTLVAGTSSPAPGPESQHTGAGSPATASNPVEVPEPDESDQSDRVAGPIAQSEAAAEDAATPEQSDMTEPAPSRVPSKPPAEPSAEQAAEPASEPSPAPQEAEDDAANEQDSTELRVSAAALTAALAAAAPPVENSSRSWIGTVLVTLVAVIALLGVGYATLPSWRDHLPPAIQDHLGGTAAFSDALQRENSALANQVTGMSAKLQVKDAEIAAAQSRIAAMEKRADDRTALLAEREKALADMRAANTEGAAATAENATLKGRIAALDKLLAAEKEARAAAEAAQQKAEALAAARADTAAKLTATVDESTGKIAGLEKNLDDARKAAVLAGKTDAIAVAAQKLRDALAGNAPFTTEIQALKDTAGEAPAVAGALGPIEPLASSGVATRNDLFAGLPATVAAVVAADRRPKNDGWIDRSIAKLTSFVTVRRIDGKGSGADAIVARAEIAARRGDLAAAVAELSALTGPGEAAAVDWLKSAGNRLAADRARQALDKIILTGAVAGDRS